VFILHNCRKRKGIA